MSAVSKITNRQFPNLYCMLRNYSSTKLKAGDIAIVSKKITEEEIAEFSRLTGDTNPIHNGERGIVHGAYLNGLVSGIIGTKLPGPGVMVVLQNLRFPNKCYVGDLVTVQVQLCSLRKLLHVEYSCVVDGRTVLEGDAKLVFDK